MFTFSRINFTAYKNKQLRKAVFQRETQGLNTRSCFVTLEEKGFQPSRDNVLKQ
jgi:Cdc6-like AAA superfamily ATPase